MLITNVNTSTAPTRKQKVKADSNTEAAATEKDTFKKTVTGAAYATGGALGGMALGAVTGEVMSHLTQNELFSTFGGGVGAIGGAATTLALSLSNEPVSVARTFGAWAGSSAGAAGGMYVLGGVGRMLAEGGASALFGTHGALFGALGAGVAGAGIAFAGDNGKVGTIVKSAAKASTGVLTGAIAGGIAQSIASNYSHLAPLGASAPIVGAAFLGLVGVQNEINKGWANGYDYKARSQTLDTVTKSALGGTIGYGAGFLAGAVGHTMTGAAGYSAILPVVAAGVGAVGALGSIKSSETLIDLAYAGGATGMAGVVGDLVGRGLTALTGQTAFTYLGAAAGAATGATSTLATQGYLKNRYVAPTIGGTVGGTVAGTLLGSALTALTGHSGYQLAGTAIGATAGLFLGLAGGAHLEEPGQKAVKSGA